MKQSQFILKLILIFSFWAPLTEAKKVIEDMDYIYMHRGLPISYKLPDDFSDQILKLRGNYKSYTKAIHRKDRNDIFFTPTRTGSALMIIKNEKNEILKRISISIQKDNLHKIAAELRDLLIAVDGINIKIYNKKVIIDGQVMLPNEMDRINKIVSDYDQRLVRSFVTYSPMAQKKVAELIENEIGYPELIVRYAYNRFLLEGCVNSIDEKIRAINIAELYTQFEVTSVGKGAQRRQGVKLIKDDIKVPCASANKEKKEKDKKNEIEKLIQIVVHFVEMSKSFNKGFLFQWTPAIGDQGTQVNASLGNDPRIPSGVTAVITATVANFFPKLNWAKSFNFARVLHNSSILVENKQTGSISTTTEVPQQTNSDGVIISGGVSGQVNTTVIPKIIGPRENMIQLKVQIQVSSPADKGTNTRNINTSINVRDGSSAAIGGLTSSFLVRKYNDDPSPASGTPLLNLHSSKNYDTKKTQFVVFITPIIKSSASVGVERIKEKFRLEE
ncbi:MAG: hypothetical protein OXJ52_07925 [Oligoflexia bacterium]|nr:hypothetical protein [Oligoflexia bacterium]